MSDVSLLIECEQYLREWFIFDCGGCSPVRLRKNSPEAHVLNFCLRPKSEAAGSDPDPDPDDSLRIIIPWFRAKNPEIYNYISPRGRKTFIEILRKRFDLQLWNDLEQVIPSVDREEDLIYSWMEAHGMELSEKNFSAVAKRLQRIRNRLKTRVRVREFRKKR